MLFRVGGQFKCPKASLTTWKASYGSENVVEKKASVLFVLCEYLKKK